MAVARKYMLTVIVKLLKKLGVAGMSSDEWDEASGHFKVSQQQWRDYGVKVIVRRLTEMHIEDRRRSRSGGSHFRIRVDDLTLISDKPAITGLWRNIYSPGWLHSLTDWELLPLQVIHEDLKMVIPAAMAQR